MCINDLEEKFRIENEKRRNPWRREDWGGEGQDGVMGSDVNGKAGSKKDGFSLPLTAREYMEGLLFKRSTSYLESTYKWYLTLHPHA